MRCVFFLLLLLTALPAQAQRSWGWYAGPSVAATEFNGEAGVLTGIEAGVVVNHRLLIGFESYRLFNDIASDQPDDEGNRNAEFFFSGLNLAYVYPVTDRLRVEPNALVGGGEAHWREGRWNGFVGDWHRDDQHTTSLVIAPGLDLSYRLSSLLQVTAGANYRFVTAGESRVVDQDDMQGFTGSLGLRIGRF